MLHGTVLTTEPSSAIDDVFALQEAAEDVVDFPLVNVEFADVMTDVLIWAIPKKIKLGPVRPQDSSVGANLAQRL